jgi:membrane-bound serine protease (ClpP class)
MDLLWVWGILLLILGFALAVLEVFFPSAGILGFLSLSALLGGILLGFMHGAVAGLGILLLTVVGLPVVVVLAFKYWPKTAIGRRVLLNAPETDDVLPANPRKAQLKALIGQVGRAKSKMLPAGAITIDGRTVDAVSEGVPIDEGQPVRVIEVRGYRVVVRPVDDETPDQQAENPLERPIDDPFA